MLSRACGRYSFFRKSDEPPIGRDQLARHRFAIGAVDAHAVFAGDRIRDVLDRRHEQARLRIAVGEILRLRDHALDDHARLRYAAALPLAHRTDRVVHPMRKAEHAPDARIVILRPVERIIPAPAHLAREGDLRAVELIEREQAEILRNRRVELARLVFQIPAEDLEGESVLRFQRRGIDPLEACACMSSLMRRRAAR